MKNRARSRVARLPKTISEIRWQKRRVIGMGGYSVVYEIATGLCVKVGRVSQGEADAQQHLARHGFALPVMDYASNLTLPAVVHRQCCGRHGIRQDILAEDGVACTCAEALDVLLMPIANPDISAWAEAVLHTFRLKVDRVCEGELGRIWDYRPANVANYQGHLVALDLGESHT